VIHRRADLVVGAWGARFRGRSFSCSIGRGGIGRKRGEGDGITPRGSFQIMGAGFRADRISPPRSPIPMLPIGPADIWSDDASDPAYNHGFRARAHPFSHERLFRADPLYDVFAILDFNWPLAVPGRGSAIFLHHWRRPRYPTEGCIAFAPTDLAFILAHWTAQSRVVIR